MFRLILFYLIFLLLFSCQNTKDDNKKSVLNIGKFDKQSSIKINKIWIKDEIFKIDQYCNRQGWEMLNTESGLRYKIISSSNSYIMPISGSNLVISYDIRLMDSKQTKCYHSDSGGYAKFKVDQSMIESGIHEVVTYLHKNDSALVILPHHIAHGITGDSKLIPPLSTVLYFIKIIDVQ